MPRTARVLALANGKGGVGKTNIAVNLAVALRRMGRRTLLVDGDLGMANAAILLGLNPDHTLDDFLEGDASLDAVLLRGPGGLLLLPGGSGTGALPRFDGEGRRRLAQALRPHRRDLDWVLVDTPSGAANQAMEISAASDRVLLILSTEPTSFMDAYATVKRLTLDHGCTAFSVVANMVESEAGGRDLFRRFADVAARFLPSDMHFLGSVPRDPKLHEAVLHKRSCLESFPAAPASLALAQIARAIDDMAVAPTRGGDTFFALETLHASR